MMLSDLFALWNDAFTACYIIFAVGVVCSLPPVDSFKQGNVLMLARIYNGLIYPAYLFNLFGIYFYPSMLIEQVPVILAEVSSRFLAWTIFSKIEYLLSPDRSLAAVSKLGFFFSNTMIFPFSITRRLCSINLFDIEQCAEMLQYSSVSRSILTEFLLFTLGYYQLSKLKYWGGNAGTDDGEDPGKPINYGSTDINPCNGETIASFRSDVNLDVNPNCQLKFSNGGSELTHGNRGSRKVPPLFEEVSAPASLAIICGIAVSLIPNVRNILFIETNSPFRLLSQAADNLAMPTVCFLYIFLASSIAQHLRGGALPTVGQWPSKVAVLLVASLFQLLLIPLLGYIFLTFEDLFLPAPMLSDFMKASTVMQFGMPASLNILAMMMHLGHSSLTPQFASLCLLQYLLASITLIWISYIMIQSV